MEEPRPDFYSVIPDLVYKEAGGKKLLIDIYHPVKVPGPHKMVLFIHGGGWHSGDKKICPVQVLLAGGLAAACFNYRLSSEAPFPAQIHDAKAAVRWLRVNAFRYNIAPKRIGVWGMSAGAHLAALLGTTGGVAAMEGARQRGRDRTSSRVQAVAAWFPPTDFLAMKYEGYAEYAEAVRLLLRLPRLEDLPKHAGQAKAASPMTYASRDDAPFMIMHGTLDRVVPVEQSRLLHQALIKAGADSTLKILPGASHGPGFNMPQVLQIREFFHRHLAGTE